MTRPHIRVIGLKEFRASLKEVDQELPKALRIALNKSVEIIVDFAHAHIEVKSGRAKRSVKARSTQTTARVQGGGKKASHYAWLDFGGRVGKDRSIYRPVLKNGRYIYNGYFRNRDRYGELLQESLVDVARQAGIEID
jgi:hypothetical protein